MGEKESQQSERKPHDGIIRRQVDFDVRGLDSETRSFDMTASTTSLDSHGDVVEQNFVLTRYRKNPVVLWNHNAFGFLDGSRPEDFLPIGKSSKIRVEDGALQMRMTLLSGTEEEEPLVNKIWRRVQQGVQKASSIGFRPGLVHEEKTPGGTIYHLDENELYEVSLVPIGSNPDAVAKTVARDHEWLHSIAKPWTNPKSVQVPGAVGKALVADPKDSQHPLWTLQNSISRFVDDSNVDPSVREARERATERGAVPYYAYPPKDTESWDGSAAESRVRAWASSDGSGDKDKIDWAKYRSAFAWYDDSNAEDFGGYKLIHHDVYNGGLITSRAGVQAAGNVIQGARGGTSIPSGDVPKVKQHLEKHYAQFDLVAPWHKSADENQSAVKGREEKKAKNMDLETIKAELEKAQKELIDLRVQKGISDEKLKLSEDKLKASDEKVTKLEGELATERKTSEKLTSELASASARVAKAEGGLVELMVDSFVGSRITPAEKTEYVELALGKKNDKGEVVEAGIGADRVKRMLEARPELKLTKSVTVNGKNPAEKNAAPEKNLTDEESVEDPAEDVLKALDERLAANG